MVQMPQSSHRCAPVREWISRALDGELSRFEQVLLDAHLSRCAACRAFREQLGATTEALRAAPPLPLEQPIRVERRRRGPLELVRPFAAAAATIVIVTGSVAVSYQPGDDGLRVAHPDVRAGVVAQRDFQRTMREIRLERALGASTLTRPFQRPPSVSVPLTPP
jgi:predicted anti-sigma-YlaC factor YlaD